MNIWRDSIKTGTFLDTTYEMVKVHKFLVGQLKERHRSYLDQVSLSVAKKEIEELEKIAAQFLSDCDSVFYEDKEDNVEADLDCTDFWEGDIEQCFQEMLDSANDAFLESWLYDLVLLSHQACRGFFSSLFRQKVSTEMFVQFLNKLEGIAIANTFTVSVDYAPEEEWPDITPYWNDKASNLLLANFHYLRGTN